MQMSIAAIFAEAKRKPPGLAVFGMVVINDGMVIHVNQQVNG